MLAIYQVIHNYDIDGGFGDAVSQSEVVATFTTRSQANRFVAKYAKPHVYYRPYADLHCGYLEVREFNFADMDVEPDESEMWWLHNDVLPDYEEDDEEDDGYDYEHELFLQGRAWDI